MNHKQIFIFQGNIFNKETMTSVCREPGRVHHYLIALRQYVVTKMQLYVTYNLTVVLNIPSLH